MQRALCRACPLCELLQEGKLEQAGHYLKSLTNSTCTDNSAVYLAIKHYSQFVTEHSQSMGISLNLVWNSGDSGVNCKKESVMDILQQMFKLGMSPNTVAMEELPLLCAISTHDEDLVKLLLENGADVNVMTPMTEMNATALAIILNDPGILRLLLSFGAKVNEPCCQSLTPLQLSMNKSVEVSKILLLNGADVHQVMQMRGNNEVLITNPPLIHAVETNNVYLASILIEHGEDINQCYGECTDSAIHFAIKQGNNDMVKLLIQNGANLNKRNGRGYTPLGLALYHCKDDSSIAQTLLEAGCSRIKGSIINVFRKHFPPLHIAAFLGSRSHFDILKLLIKKSVLVEKETEGNCLASSSQSNLSNDSELDRCLLNFGEDKKLEKFICYCKSSECGSDLNSEDVFRNSVRKNKQGLSNSERAVDLEKQGQQDFINIPAIDKSTALYMAVLGGNLDIAEYLLANGADPYNTCWHGSLLHAAVMARRQGEEVLNFALQFDYDLDLQNEDGNTCLILAARNNTPAVCAMLIENGALLDVQDGRYGETALSASVYFGFEGNAEVLLSHGANPDLPDFRDTSALYWAIFNCREKSLRLLLEAGARLSRDDLAKYPKNIKIMKKPELKKLLQDYVSEPRSLQQCCRLTLRKHLAVVNGGRSILSSLMSLLLPGKLKNFLALKAVM